MNKYVDVIAVVEGPTEQTFIRDVLSPYLAIKGIIISAPLIGKPGHKGGTITFERMKNDIFGFVKQRRDTFVTTMFDYFRIDSDWPGKARIRNHMSATQKSAILEDATLEELEKSLPEYNVINRFIPYIEMYEFEAILFSDTAILAKKIGVEESVIANILQECAEPEEINDGAETAPSKRLIALNPGYRKVAMGKSISETIGIETIRERCPHFHGWLKKLEELAR